MPKCKLYENVSFWVASRDDIFPFLLLFNSRQACRAARFFRGCLHSTAQSIREAALRAGACSIGNGLDSKALSESDSSPDYIARMLKVDVERRSCIKGWERRAAFACSRRSDHLLRRQLCGLHSRCGTIEKLSVPLTIQ